MHVTHDPTPLRDLNPRPVVSDELARIIMKMIAKQPTDRYADVVVLRTDLENQLARVEKERAQRYVSVRPMAFTSKHLTEDEIRIRESAPTMTPEGHTPTASRRSPAKAYDSSAPTGPAPAAVAPPSDIPGIEPRGSSPWMIILIVLAGLGLAGGGLWFFGLIGSRTADIPATPSVAIDVPVPTRHDPVVVPPVVATVRDAGRPDTHVAPPPPPPPLVAPVPARRDAGTRRRGPCVPNFFTGERCP